MHPNRSTHTGALAWTPSDTSLVTLLPARLRSFALLSETRESESEAALSGSRWWRRALARQLIRRCRGVLRSNLRTPGVQRAKGFQADIRIPFSDSKNMDLHQILKQQPSCQRDAEPGPRAAAAASARGEARLF